MAKTKEAAASLCLQEYKNMKKEIKELKNKDKESNKKCKVLEKQYKDVVKQNKELEKKLEKAENQKVSDINNILSEHARVLIKASKGPLTPDKLQNFIITDLLGKRNIDPATIFKKYSEYDVHEVKHQLSCFHDILKAHMEHREKQMKLDDKLINVFEKLKIVPQNNSKCNRKGVLDQNSGENSNENCGRKRKLPYDDSSQDGSQENSQEIHNTQDNEVKKFYTPKIIKMITKRTNVSSEDFAESRNKT